MQWTDSPLRLGTCSWTAKGWTTSFYQRTKKPTELIGEYAERFSTVEVDASFYATPRRETVQHWDALTPPGFVFAAKVPRIITHDKFLEGCGQELQAFLDTMGLLGPKLGPLLIQFPYFAKSRGVTLSDFLHRLLNFIHLLPKEGFQFAVEVRNKNWISAPLIDLLGDHQIALALIDHPWMAPPDQLFRQQGILTAPFTYIRWLGDRHAIEKITKVWDKPVLDQRARTETWIPHIKETLDRQVRVYGYVNNHYSGHAPADLAFLQERLGSAPRQDESAAPPP